MGKTTAIQWTDHSWNPWQGCFKVSPGCKNCYMYSEKKHYGQNPMVVVRSKPPTFNAPLKWREPAKVFTCSWSDWFLDEADEWRAEAWDIVRRTPHLTYQILTKRPERVLDHLPADWGKGWPNVWLGTSVENQQYADERIPHLLRVPAVVRFLSAEPLLGPVDLDHYLIDDWTRIGDNVHYHTGDGLHWVITGGESGPHARPCHPDWVRSLRDQSVAAKVAFFHKQWGEWCPGQLQSDGVMQGYWEFQQGSAFHAKSHGDPESQTFQGEPRGDWRRRTVRRDEEHPDTAYLKLGKLWSGCSLDGRVWDQFPDALGQGLEVMNG